MDAKMTALKIGIATVTTALADVLGWKGILLIILAVMMLLDYISGSLAARKEGAWSSTVARQGIFHKGGTLFVVLVAFVFDAVLSVALPQVPFIGRGLDAPGIFLPLVSVWYIITEIGSVLENAVKMGAPVPKWFRKAVGKAGELVDETGEAAADKADVDNRPDE